MSAVVRLRALILAAHAGPTVTVTFVIAAVAAAAGRDHGGVLLVAAAVFTGQLSIGWSNDARDAERDRRAARTEKPTVRGEITAAELWTCAGLALATSVVMSLVAGGLVGGTAHVVSVLSAWTYNLALKTTVLSWLPYAVSFGLVPVFVTYGLTPAVAPATWIVMTCALMGVGAHLANALPDVDSDTLVAAGGLVAAIGAGPATVATLASLVGAVALLVSHLPLPGALAAGIVTLVAVGAVAVATLGRGRALFRFVLLLAAAVVVLLIGSAGSITA